MSKHQSKETAEPKNFVFGDNTVGKHVNGTPVAKIIEKLNSEKKTSE